MDTISRLLVMLNNLFKIIFKPFVFIEIYISTSIRNVTMCLHILFVIIGWLTTVIYYLHFLYDFYSTIVPKFKEIPR